MTQDIERRHACRHVQRVVNGSEDHTNAQANTAGALTDCRESEVGSAVVRPHRAEVVFGKPHTGKALFFGKRDLLQSFVDAFGLTGCSPRFRDLNLIEQADSHGTVSFRIQMIV